MHRTVRRVWSENVPFEVLAQYRVLSLLRARSIRLIVAVNPCTTSEIGALVASCNEASVEVALWPLLGDELGRWPNDGNVDAFAEHLLRVLTCVETVCSAGTEVVFDLEPPIATTRRLLDFRAWDGRVRLRPADLDAASRRFADLAGEVRERGFVPTAVVAPVVLFDRMRSRGGWQRLLGTPVDGVGFDRVTVMAYTTLIEGYSRRALARRHARALLRDLCELARERWPQRAAIALGVVGGGALGDEAPYRDVAELVDDVAIARAAGVDDLALYSLEGVLERSPSPEAWLDSFVGTEPADNPPRPSARGRALTAAARYAGRSFDAFCRLLRVEPR